MKTKTSISLSQEILARIRTLTSEGNRSDFIEKALWRYIEILHREERANRDIEIINNTANRLNKEAADVLSYQAEL